MARQTAWMMTMAGTLTLAAAVMLAFLLPTTWPRCAAADPAPENGATPEAPPAAENPPPADAQPQTRTRREMPTERLTRNVFWIGNSYTYFNNLPELVKQLAANSPLKHVLHSQATTPGGAKINEHWGNSRTVERVRTGNFDAIIIQGQSQEALAMPPSFTEDTPGGRTDLIDFTQKFAEIIDGRRANGHAIELVMFVTWARAAGDRMYGSAWAGNTPREMQANINEGYRLAVGDSPATFAMVGDAWMAALDADANLSLYTRDKSHPTMQGSYLSACVLFETLFGESSIGNPYRPRGISAEQAQLLQRIATQVTGAPRRGE